MPEVDHECVYNVIDESEPFAMFCSICDKRMPKPEYRGIAGYARAVDTSKPICPEVKTTKVVPVGFIYHCATCNYPINIRLRYCPDCGRKIIWE